MPPVESEGRHYDQANQWFFSEVGGSVWSIIAYILREVICLSSDINHTVVKQIKVYECNNISRVSQLV